MKESNIVATAMPLIASLVGSAALLFILAVGPAVAATIAMPDGSLTTTAGTYGWAYSFFDTAGNPKSPDRWNITASDFIMQGQIRLSDINAKARWNTWDDNLGDGVDKLGAWFNIGPYAGSGHGVYLATVQWTGGGDTANDIRWIFHPQEVSGSQPDPKYYTGPYNTAEFSWLDDWINFKIVVHATSATTGSAQYWIHDELISGQGQVPNPGIDTFYFTLSGGADTLENIRVYAYLINGNNPNNPSFTVDWRNVTITGTPVPLPGAVWLLGSGLAGLGGLSWRRKRA